MKNELKDLKHRLATESNLLELRMELRLGVSEIKASITQMKTDILKWTIFLIVSLLMVMVTFIIPLWFK